jgi:hypothetical protein
MDTISPLVLNDDIPNEPAKAAVNADGIPPAAIRV